MKSILHFGKFLMGIEPPNSQVTDRELELLKRYCSNANIMVEIGCKEGKTSASLARNGPGTVYTIDPFPKGRLGFSYSEVITRVHFKRSRLTNVKIIRGYSSAVVQKFHHRIDFLFIDADHSYDAARRDWEDWSSHVRNGGIIGLHDCKPAVNSPNYLGSMKFYEHDILRKSNIKELESVDSLVIFQVIA